MTAGNGMRPIHPGEIWRAEYLAPRGRSANALAQDLGVPADRLSLIVRERRGVSADTALRPARYCDTTPAFGMKLRSGVDLRSAQPESGVDIRRVKKDATRVTNAARRAPASQKAAASRPSRRWRASPAAAGRKPRPIT